MWNNKEQQKFALWRVFKGGHNNLNICSFASSFCFCFSLLGSFRVLVALDDLAQHVW